MLPTLYNDDGDGFIVIAHRGASAYYPENTMAAFRGAVQMDAEMIELDVQLSSDGIPIVFHDVQLDAHTDGSGKAGDHTLKELKNLDAGSWFGSEFSGQPIPTLEEVLIFAKGRVALNLEIKTEAVTDQKESGVEQKSLELVYKYGMNDHVLFSSFDYRAIRHLKELDRKLPVALLYEKKQAETRLPSELVTDYNVDVFNCSIMQLNRKRLNDLRENNIPVLVYTVNSRPRMRRLISKGVDGIFTDRPDLLLEVAREFFRGNLRRLRS